jgi:hypothetical protein
MKYSLFAGWTPHFNQLTQEIQIPLGSPLKPDLSRPGLASRI